MRAEDPDEGDVVRRDRFSGGPARGFLSSLAEDERLFAADLEVGRAHVVMLATRDIIEDDAAAAILAALDDVEEAGFDELPRGEDVHAAIETAVIDRVGEDGGHLHTARSRNDEVATCLRYRLREDLLAAIDETLAFRGALAEAAESHAETVMPGYTHLQSAQPTTVGHWLLSYESAARRDVARLLDTYDRTNRSPLGAAAFAGTPFDIDRALVADLLGFDGVVENTMDAVSTRDFLLETAAASCSLGVTLSGIAEDLIAFTSRGLVELDDDYASTSSIMPQKKNPDTLELVRAAAGDVAAGHVGLMATLKGLPRAYNRDLQGATPHAWTAIDAATAAAEVAAGAVATATWNGQACGAAAGDGFSTATGVADRLAQAGVPFRRAHEVVATAADRTPTDGAVDYDRLDAAAREILDEPLDAFVDRETVEAALDPAKSVAMRTSQGGPAAGPMATQLDAAETALAADRDAVDERQTALASAAERLDTEVARRV